MSLEEKVKQEIKRLKESDLHRLNALNYKTKFLASQYDHLVRSAQEAERALKDASNKLEANVQAMGFELGVDIAGWDEETGAVFSKPPNGQASPQNVG